MGYYTRYSLNIKEGDHNLISDLINTREDIRCAIDESGDTEDQTKWYEHEEDLKDFSSKNPDALFELIGEGADNDDAWIKYFKNGKLQICKAIITFDNFNESKLK